MGHLAANEVAAFSLFIYEKKSGNDKKM